METYLIPCLCCDKQVVVRKDLWIQSEATFALCAGCSKLVHNRILPWAFVLMVFSLRCQISSLAHRLGNAESDLKKVYEAQHLLEG